MSDLTLAILKLGFLVLLWAFVLMAVGVMRSDLFGIRKAKDAAPVRVAAAAPPARPAPSPNPAPVATKAPRPSRKAPHSLAVTEGTLTGTTVDLAGEQITLGRAVGNTLVLEDDYVSSRHARIYPYEGGWVVEDLGSTNGTFVGSDKVTEPTLVKVGSRIKVGRTVLELRK